MNDLIIALLFIHVILYLAWKLTALAEKTSRSDGRLIPTYATGGLGNLIGFSLLTVGVGLVGQYVFSIYHIVLIALAALVVTITLHYYWRRDVRGKTASLYLPSGEVTLAGALHLPYVFYIAAMGFAFFLALPFVNVLSLALFVIGASMYGVAIIVDAKRGVI